MSSSSSSAAAAAVASASPPSPNTPRPSPTPRATTAKKTVLITGCSQHGLGYALALAFHDVGFRVFATARDVGKVQGLRDEARQRRQLRRRWMVSGKVKRKGDKEGEMGDEASGDASHGDGEDDVDIDVLPLDVLDEASIAACVAEVARLLEIGVREGRNRAGLQCLVNNAGGGYNMPVSDISIPEAKRLFDLNVWSYISITQAFLPLLITAASAPASPSTPSSPASPSLILNNTSVSSVEPTPHNSVYHASKAAAAMFSTHMRLELSPFNIHVVDLKTGCVHSRFHANHQAGHASLPEHSLYMPVREQTEAAMRNAFPHREDPHVWAASVVADVVRGWDRPPLEVWRGTGAWRTWFYDRFWPRGWWDRSWQKSVGLDVLAALRKGASE